ncbi:YihY/virulence factor BrkB family protein [Bdellovibrio sp. HCB337]|uniref:YihY/virulence factor BrkB family protein n=1 Tax=Bdellovibrio sp. HCB337 TaxID=3394358 RepID=UPI0039A66349
MKLKQLFSSDFFDKLSRDDIFDMSAALAYYTALSLAPLLILAITFVGFLGENFKDQLVIQVQDLVGSTASETIKYIAQSAEKRAEIRGWSGIVGVLTLLISAGAIFGQLRTSLNKIFDINIDMQKQADSMSFLMSSVGYIKHKIFSMGMVLTFVFISIVSLVISSFLTILFQGVILVIGQVINFFLSILIFSILFSSIYYFLPQKKLSRKTTLSAGLITAILFSLGKTAIGLYLGQSALASAYGAAGSMIVLLMWVYYSSLIIFLSAEIAYRVEKVFFNGKNTLLT